MESVVERVEKHFSYPVFIKPSNAGSSRGVTKADDRQALEADCQRQPAMTARYW